MLKSIALWVLAGACCLQGVIAAEPPPNDLAGTWVTEVTQRTPTPQLLTFTHQGASWAGALTTAFGVMDLQDIVFGDDHVSFSERFKGGFGPETPITAQATLRGNELVLRVLSPVGVFVTRVAHRALPREVATIQAATPAAASLTALPDNGLARTPPMGWNSWNHFGAKIDDKTVREVADALVASGLRDAGYVYVNIDDGWQGERDATGALHANARFPDMKGLAGYVHSRGLKFGLYSGPGPRTCAGFEGSYGHEEQDAKTYAAWGVDYLKYDWCSANNLYSTPFEMQAAYLKMGAALQASGHPIVYSLCQYGLFDVGRWARQVGGNLWRTTFDILDYWAKMEEIGFSQNGHEADAGPGGWNDPDMLEIGNGGMSADEYRTHLTLWSMLSAPLLLGNDIRAMTPETRALLANQEVIAIDQDPLGRQARRLRRSSGSTEVWSKPLADGSVAVALFNRGDVPNPVELHASDVGLPDATVLRDLWQQTDLPAKPEGYRTTLPPHGSVLLRISSKESIRATTQAAAEHPSTTINIVFIGDSITQGVQLSDPEHQAPPAVAADWLRAHLPYASVFFSNQGRAGHTTVDELPTTQTDFPAIEQAANELQSAHPGRLVFSIMLGTNDSAVYGPLGSPVTPADYRKNLATIIDHLLQDYPTAEVILDRPTWYSPNTYNAARYLAEGLARLEQYSPQIDTLVAGYNLTHPHHVYRGDTEGFSFFKSHSATDLIPESGQMGTFYLHPNAQGATVLGQFWGKAIERVLHAP